MSELKQRATLFADMAKGGYFQTWDIFDGATRVGGKIVNREHRGVPERTTYVLITPGHEMDLKDHQTFDNLKDFLAAYEARKETEPVGRPPADGDLKP